MGVLCAVPALLMAKPAKPELVTLTQPDGTRISVRLEGDEHGHLVFDANGRLLTKDARGFYVDAGASESDVKAKRAEMMQHRAKRIGGGVATRATADGSNYGLFSQPKPIPSTGSPKCVVILVEYPNQKFTINNPQDFFYRMLNQDGFDEYGAMGSAAQFYSRNSLEAFTPQFDVYGPVMLPNEYGYYGGNDMVYGQDMHPEEMAIHACQQLDDDVDFSQYDYNNDGQIDFVYIFYAGYGEADGADSDRVWPHSWSLDEAGSRRRYTFDNVRLNKYACSNELQFEDDTPDGMGSFVHEFSHVLGLADHYSSLGYTYDTPSYMDVMDVGCYNNNSHTPPNYSSFELYALGWLEPELMTESGRYELKNLHDSRKAWMVKSKQNPNERFFIENRQQTGNDTYLRGHGMLVWHIEFNQDVWNANDVNNNPFRRGVDLVPADGVYAFTTLDGDPFPGTSGNTSFTPTSTPAFLTWDLNPLGLSITEISESNDGIISFYVESSISSVNAVEADGLDLTVNGNAVSVASGNAAVFDTLGRHIANVGTNPTTLPAGIYIVYRDGLKSKIIVR